MRFLLLIFVLVSSPSLWADTYLDLYKKSGWPQQQAHFSSALQHAQQRYQNTLPNAIYQALVDNSNNRFAADAMQVRGQKALRQHLDNPAPALAFFPQALAKKLAAQKQLPPTHNNSNAMLMVYRRLTQMQHDAY